jgi:hypothetical protein
MGASTRAHFTLSWATSLPVRLFLVLVGATACGSATPLGPDGGGGSASIEGGSVPENATTGDARTLVLIASGGAAGEIAAEVPLLEQPGVVGTQVTCMSPLDAGACQLTSCRRGAIGSPSPGHGNFGPISASVGTTIVPLTYDRVGYPTVAFPSSIALGEGGIMRFRGGNWDGVPAFDVSATIPGLAIMTSPVPTTAAGSAIVNTSQDLSVTWVPITIGQVHFQLEGVIPPPSPEGVGEVVISVACTFEGASGSGVVPRALLSPLKAMSGTSPTSASLRSELDTTTVVSELTVVTQSYQNSPTAGRAVNVTLQ